MTKEALEQMQALEAVASEHGMTLAFRACDESEGYEPVFLRVTQAGIGGEGGAVMIAVSDGDNLSLGRYVVPRKAFDAALAQAEESPATTFG